MNNLIQRLQSGKTAFKLEQPTRQIPQQQQQQLPPTQYTDDVDNDNSLKLGFDEEENKPTPKPSILNVTKQIKKQIIQKNPSGKKKLKPLGIREPWTEKHRVLHMSRPEEIQDKRSRKRFRIRLQFMNDRGQRRNCTIRFGSNPKEQKDYIDHHNPEKRNMTLLRLKHNCDSVLNPNYWRIWLLNTEDTMEKAWNNYIQMPDHNYLQL